MNVRRLTRVLLWPSQVLAAVIAVFLFTAWWESLDVSERVEFAAVFAWLTVIAWNAIALPFLGDCARVYVRTRREYRLARLLGNGRVLVAKYRKRQAGWYVLGSGIACAAGLMAFYSTAFLPQPPPDTRLVTSLTRILLITMIFAFWRTKRLTIALYREVDAKHRRDIEVSKRKMPEA